jgi:hypothetical protein
MTSRLTALFVVCAYDLDPEKQAKLKPCQHTRFMVHDEGFEDRSARFDQLMGIEGVADDDVELGDKGYDGFTDRVCCPDSVKFTPYPPRGSTAMLPDWRRGRET